MGALVRLPGAALATLLLSASSFAQDLSSPDPAGAGFSADRLARIAPWHQSRIERGALTGAVVAIARNGKLAYLQPIGTQDRVKTVPMKANSIFWIASMTKPVTSVAAMMLVEEGKLELEAPVAKYLPELADMKVGLERVPPRRPMQVIDLLRHTAGLTYPEEGNDALHDAYGVVHTFRRDRTLADFITGLSAAPLVHQPGEVWEYSWGVDVLARVVEVVSGQPFDRFLEDRIFKPLGMVDTGFVVPEDKLDRLVDPLPSGRPRIWDVTKPAKLFSGGGGLVSTAPDYLRFCQMLLNGGELDGARLLSAKTVQQMTTNALPPDTRFAGEGGKYVGPRVGTTWGLGFAVRTNPEFSLLPGGVGSFGWSGYWGTYFWVDPVVRLIGVQMVQVEPGTGARYQDALRHLTYAALSVRQPPEPAATPPPRDVGQLERYVGTYDFGQSLSVHDRRAPIPAFSFTGVGLEIDIVDGAVTVRSPTIGGPAARVGLKAGDVVAEVDGVPVQGLGLEPVIAKLRDAAGKQVRLKIVRRDKSFDVTIVREVIGQAGIRIKVKVVEGELVVTAVGPWSVFDFEKDKQTVVKLTADREFRNPGGDNGRLLFRADSTGKTTGVVLNPGPEQIEARKID